MFFGKGIAGEVDELIKDDIDEIRKVFARADKQARQEAIEKLAGEKYQMLLEEYLADGLSREKAEDKADLMAEEIRLILRDLERFF